MVKVVIFLIPNKKNIGIGKQKSNKKNVGIRHCTIEEFKDKGLGVDDVELKHLLTHLKPFYEKDKNKEKFKQMELFENGM